jgi:DNA polymerase-3 subunit delta
MDIYKFGDNIRSEASRGERNLDEEGLIITDIRQAVKNENRVNIFVNGKYSFSLDIAQVVDLGIKKGLIITEEQLADYKKASEFGKAYQRALEWVLTRPHSERELADYLKDMPETTSMIFIETEVDKRNKLYKAVQSKGRVVELNRQDETTLLRWVKTQIDHERKEVSENTVHYLLSKVGTDMEHIQRELEKLFCYTFDKKSIAIEDVDTICTTQITNQIFDMVNAVAERQQKKALQYYYDLLALKEPPMKILFLLARQFKILMEVKSMDQKGYAKKEIAEKVGINPFVVGKYQVQAKAFKINELRNIIEDSVETEESVKTGKLNDTLGVELFIVKYSK